MAGWHMRDLNNSISSDKIVNYAHRSFFNRCVCPLSTYSDSQNYVYRGQFFLSWPLLQWKKRGKNLFELNKHVNIRKSTLLYVK